MKIAPRDAQTDNRQLTTFLPDIPLHADEGEQFEARGFIFQEAALQLARRRPRAGLLHAAITHTKVLALQDNGHALGPEHVPDGIGNLSGEFFLYL